MTETPTQPLPSLTRRQVARPEGENRRRKTPARIKEQEAEETVARAGQERQRTRRAEEPSRQTGHGREDRRLTRAQEIRSGC